MRFVCLGLLLVGCMKDSAPPETSDHPPIAQPEIDRGEKLCQAYVDRVCKCAERDPSLRDTCELSKGQPSAVRMHLEVLQGAPLAQVGPNGEPEKTSTGKRPPLNENERRLTESSLRKVIAACVDLDAKLDPKTCPR